MQSFFFILAAFSESYYYICISYIIQSIGFILKKKKHCFLLYRKHVFGMYLLCITRYRIFYLGEQKNVYKNIHVAVMQSADKVTNYHMKIP